MWPRPRNQDVPDEKWWASSCGGMEVVGIMKSIKKPVRAYEQQDVSGMWSIRDASNVRLAHDLTEGQAKEIVLCLNTIPELVKWSNSQIDRDKFGMSFDDFVKKYDCSPDESKRRFKAALKAAEDVP